MSVTLAFLIALSVPAAGPSNTVLEAIDAKHQRGEITDYTRHLYRVAVLKRPDRLPVDLQQLLTTPRSDRWTSGTRLAVEAWQWISRNNAQGSELYELLQPPDDYPYVIDSDVLPLRISYKQEQEQALAQGVLQAAEYSWTTEVDALGFLPPPIQPGTMRYRLYLDDAGSGAAAYCAPYEANPVTPWTDCHSYIVVDQSNGLGAVDGIVAHEMSHATQAAMDCEEITAFWENTSTYIMSQVYPDSWDYTLATMAYFQAKPWHSIDFMERWTGSDLSEYGGALLLIYLTDAFAAPGEGGAMVADIWTASMQEVGDFNEPDYFDGIVSVVAARGGASSFADIFMDFSEARYFVGDNDDGAHITDADTFYGAEPTLAGRFFTPSLPVAYGQPDLDKRPQPYGVSYILGDFAGGYPYGLQLRFDGDDRSRWAVRVLRYGNGLPMERHDLAPDPETGSGGLDLEATGHRFLLMLAASLGPEGFDPDQSARRSYLFTYDVDPVLPPLAVHSMEPGTVERGRQMVDMVLRGDGFVDGAQFTVGFDDLALRVTSIKSVSATQVELVVRIHEETELGLHSVTVKNRDDERATGVDLLEMVDEGAL